MLEILFMGICLFAERTGGGRTVVLPALDAGATVDTPCAPVHVEEHHAYISVDADDVVSCTDCQDLGKGQAGFELREGALSITGLGDTAFKEDQTFAALIPSMKKTCSAFRLAVPPSATTLKLVSGTLSAERRTHDERISKLEVAATGNVTFANAGRTMVVNPQATVTIGNEGKRKLGGKHALAENHWLAFYSLARTPVSCVLPKEITGPGQETTIACSNSQYP